MLYLHIPFCHSKCIYCDFFSTPLARSLYSDYIDALGAELEMRVGELPAPPSSVYIGGGTPSILPLELSAKLFERIIKDIDPNSVKEWTIEMNPEDVSPDRLKLYRNYGINRISMGVQSFHDATLKAIGRRHTASQAIEAIRMIQAEGFNHSLDLIYGLPGEDMKMWESSLNQLLDFHPDHFSAYLLSYEPGTALYRMAEKGKITEASEELAIEMYNLLCDRAKQSGYEHYEISNFALPGKRSYHNSRYWTGTQYLGIGCSAHSFTNGTRKSNPADIKNYISSIANGMPFYDEEKESPEEQLNDLIITALRTCEGLSLTSLSPFPADLTKEFLQNMEKELTGERLKISDGHIFIPENHWLEADAVMRNLIV